MTKSLNVSSGEIEGGVHSFPIRVYYEDTDAGGIVYHSQYLNFMERGRTEMLRLCGFSHIAMMTTQISPTLLIVKHMEIDFKGPAKLDDQLLITSEITKLGAASMMISQAVLCDGETLVIAKVKVGVLGSDKRPKKMNSEQREQIMKTLKLGN